jgi:hypothetical protein
MSVGDYPTQIESTLHVIADAAIFSQVVGLQPSRRTLRQN